MFTEEDPGFSLRRSAKDVAERQPIYIQIFWKLKKLEILGQPYFADSMGARDPPPHSISFKFMRFLGK